MTHCFNVIHVDVFTVGLQAENETESLLTTSELMFME